VGVSRSTFTRRSSGEACYCTTPAGRYGDAGNLRLASWSRSDDFAIRLQ
jgi:hypothetical protein